MRIAHLSDLHVSSLSGVCPARLFNKRLTGYANWQLRRSSMHRSEYVGAIAREIAQQAVDHVVITGDLTNLALEQEFDLAREVLRDGFGLDTSRVSVVPGNHDLYTGGAEREQRFATCFADYIASDLPLYRVSVPAGWFPFVKLRGPVAIIGLSSALARAPLVAAGRLGRSQLHALARILEDKEVRGRTPIIALHHPVHNPPSWIKSTLEGLSDAGELREILNRLTRGIVLHGHLHRRVRRSVRTIAGSIPAVGATSASLCHDDPARAAGFNLYEIDDAGSVTHVDAHIFEPAHGTFRSRPIAATSEYPPPLVAGVNVSRLARAVLCAAVLVALVGSSMVARRTFRRRGAVMALKKALVGYAECMLGAPLADGETATARLRRIEAGLPERSPTQGPATPDDAWPLRCRSDLDHAHAELAGEALARSPAFLQLDALVLRAHFDPAPADAPDLVDDLLRAASVAGVPASPRRYPPATSHLAPAPAMPLTADALAPLPVRVSCLPDEIPGTDARVLRLSFFDTRVAPWTCAFTAVRGEALREARCGEVKPGAAVTTPDEAAPPGFVRTQRGRFDRFELVRPVPDADPHVDYLPPSTGTVALYGDQLVWVAAHRWYVRTVPLGRAPMGAPVDLGEVVGDAPELELCQTTTAIVVGVKTFDEALGGRRSWRVMAAREDGTWRRTPGHAIVDVGATLTCEGHAGTWSWFDRRVVTQVRCNADRCEIHASERMTLPWDVGGPLFAADLGGRALVLGLGATPGPLTGKTVTSVRMRMAPLAAISHASDVVLFSDQAHDGAVVADVTVYIRDGAALVLLRGDDPLPYRAIRVDGLGNFVPVTIVD